ncbi:MAG: hypothetical protein HYX94_07005 [Chloroflexi bacterium]|nr:hypothetical protein [Chloroflexota bacterium]
MLKRIAAEQRGVTVVIVALVIVVLLGIAALVVDAGRLQETRRQLQNAVDAAALAGAQQIAVDRTKNAYNEAQVKSTAYTYANSNGVSNSEVAEVSVTSIFNDKDSVKVSAQREIDLLFAPVLGVSSRNVGATATALVTQLKYDRIWPWGIIENDLPQDEEAKKEVITLKVSPGGQPAPGDFMALGFTPGAKDYENYIKYDYNGYVPSGVSDSNPWMVPSETGNIVGPTRDGVTYLQDQAQTSPYSTNDLRYPLIGLVPILDNDAWADAEGKKPVPVIGFAIFYLYSYEGKGGQAEVKGRFLDTAYGVGESQNIGGDLTGLVGARLWE